MTEADMIPSDFRDVWSSMWPPITRQQHTREGLRYETDLSDEEWNVIEALLPSPQDRGRAWKWPPREIVNAIFYILRRRITWRLLPREAKIAVNLSIGMSLKQAAEKSAIRLNPARWYLDEIFRKTGTHERSQLIPLLTNISLMTNR